MNAATAIVIAAVFLWLGMVLAISFLEAPLKFRAPNVTLPIGLGIGRLVFRALNMVETAFAVVILIAVAADPPSGPTIAALVAAAAILAAQVAIVRPLLTRRSDAVLAGLDAPRSHSHYAYIALEVLKVVALFTGGILELVNA